MSRKGYHRRAFSKTAQQLGRFGRRLSKRKALKTRHLSVECLEARYLLTSTPYFTSPPPIDSAFAASLPPLPREDVFTISMPAGGGGLATAPFDPAQAFHLNSLPGATKTIYLDFTGHLTENTQWNLDYNLPTILTPAFNLDDDLSTFSETERMAIYSIWQRVSEDFLPFEVNVTTQEPDVEALRNTGEGDQEWGQRVIIGGDSTNDWFTPVDGRSVGGVSYGSFNWDTDTPNFVFGGDFDVDADIAEVISHETGHALGLTHDGQFRFYNDISEDPPEPGQLYVEYYAGHGDGPTAWGPIMGVGYGIALTQWSRGEYFNATNNAAGTTPLQDDLAIITSQNGFGYRADDHANDLLNAVPLEFDDNGDLVFMEGVIEQNTDQDWFTFEVFGLGEIVSFDISPFVNGANLDVLAKIYDSSGTEIYRSNPLDDIIAGGQSYASGSDGGWGQVDALGDVIGYSPEIALARGTYFISIEGAGRPITFIDPSAHPKPPDWDPTGEEPIPPDTSDWGYSNYGSLGYYSITGTRKDNLVVGVDFDASGGQAPLNWNLFTGDGGTSVTLEDLISEAGFVTDYDLTISTTGAALNTVASTSAIASDALPDHSLPLDDLAGYLSGGADETLSFVYSDLAPDTVYQIYVFGHSNVDVVNSVTVTGGTWNADTQVYAFTQDVDPNGLAVNDDETPAGKNLSTLGLLVISDANGEIRIEVTNGAGAASGIAGVAIADTELGSLSGQKWNDLDGDGQAPEDGEVGLPGFVIYLDTNNNGILDMVSEDDETYIIHAPEVPQALDDYAFVKNELIIEQTGIIRDINVTIDITHSFNGDVNVWLIAPDGTQVALVKDIGGNSDNFTNTVFDDSAATSITSATPAMAPFTGSWRPMEPLSVFNGMEASGKWTLQIQDDSPGDTGVLNAWSVEVTIEGETQILEPFQISDDLGNYTFAGLKPGQYFVREHIQEQQFLDGWRQSWAAPPVTVTSKGDITGVDFGNWIPIFTTGAVTGTVYNDQDGSGGATPDLGEVGLEGWVVYVDANNNGVRDQSNTPIVAAATDLPKAITDFNTITSSILIEDIGSVLDIEVTVDISHTFMADLEAYLTSPSGRIVELFTGVGAQFNDFHNLTFSEDALRSISTIGQADLPYTGTWRPEGSLLALFGDESAGLWTLTLRDTNFADQGSLNSWSLAVTIGERFTETDAEGNYTFGDLPPGKYIVRQEVQPGWQQTYAPPIVNDGIQFSNVTVLANNIAVANFGNQNTGPELPGDFNIDGTVDAADYVFYRKTNGIVVPPYDGADGSGNGSVGAEDLDIWVQNFGQSIGSGAGGAVAASFATGASSGAVEFAFADDHSTESATASVGVLPAGMSMNSTRAVAAVSLDDFSTMAFKAESAGSDVLPSSGVQLANDAALIEWLNTLAAGPAMVVDDLDDAEGALDRAIDEVDFADDSDGELASLDALFELIGA